LSKALFLSVCDSGKILPEKINTINGCVGALMAVFPGGCFNQKINRNKKETIYKIFKNL